MHQGESYHMAQRFAWIRPEWVSPLLFLFLSILVLPYPGVQTDEALSAAATVELVNYRDAVSIGNGLLPTMLMSFLGALKTWLYYPILGLFQPSVWSLRLPTVIIGDSGPKRTGFLGEGENRSGVKANTIPGPTRTKIPAGTRMVFVPPRNCFRDGPE